jgi:hypothetical protein
MANMITHIHFETGGGGTSRFHGHTASKAAKGFRLGKTPKAAQWHVFQVKLRAPGAFNYLQKHQGNGAEFQVHPAPPWSLQCR